LREYWINRLLPKWKFHLPAPPCASACFEADLSFNMAHMTEAIAHLLDEVERLSASERVELADHLAERLVRDISPEIEQAQLEQVRHRIAQVERGEVELIPGAQAMEQVRKSLSEAARKAE
jgi:hypothetical protein